LAILDIRYSILDDILTGPKMQIIEFQASSIDHPVGSASAPTLFSDSHESKSGGHGGPPYLAKFDSE
jgi:hypothetical protein